MPVPPLPTASAVPSESDPNDAACAKRFVLDAVVEKKFVEVALVKVVLPENVLLLARSVDEAAETVIEPPTLSGVPLIVPSAPLK